jgi:hypothetical protein
MAKIKVSMSLLFAIKCYRPNEASGMQMYALLGATPLKTS